MERRSFLGLCCALVSLICACQTVAGLDDKTAVEDGGVDGGVDGTVSDARAPDDGATATDNHVPSTCVPLAFTPDGGTDPSCRPWDGGAGDAAFDAGGTCSPHDANFVPTWKPPAPIHQGKCTQQQIDDFHRFCLGSGDAVACQSFLSTAGAKDCAGCILTQPTANVYGPLIDHTTQGFVSPNVAGCVAALEPCNESCGQALEARAQCDEAACNSCTVTDGESLKALNACTDWADKCGSCTDYARKAACENELTGNDHPASVCFHGNNFDESYAAIVPIFCGP
jgi:hypothetical protein